MNLKSWSWLEVIDLNAGTARNDEKRERNHRQGEHCSLSRDVVTIYFSNIIGVGAVRVIPILEIVSDDSLRWHYACLNFPLDWVSNTEMSNFTFFACFPEPTTLGPWPGQVRHGERGKRGRQNRRTERSVWLRHSCRILWWGTCHTCQASLLGTGRRKPQNF